jgi:hypothetical protein
MPPLNGISVGEEAIAPSAIVPSWQLKHIRDDPVGCPTSAFSVEEKYGK